DLLPRIIPPASQCRHVDGLREVYDKAYGIWPPHINLIYPFVSPENLVQAQQQIQQCLERELEANDATSLELNEVGLFKHQKSSSIFLSEAQDTSTSFLGTLRQLCLESLGQKNARVDFHLTIGQVENEILLLEAFLLAKARLLPSLRFSVGALAILIRECRAGTNASPSMRLWGIVDIPTRVDVWKPQCPEFWIPHHQSASFSAETEQEECDAWSGKEGNAFMHFQSGPTYAYDAGSCNWVICTSFENDIASACKISIASYNIKTDSEYPPERDREPLVASNILSDTALADILVLQEVSDDFLSYFLNDTEVRKRYRFASHGPPDQLDIGPLRSMRNVVILSRWSFRWSSGPFHRKYMSPRHKGALIAQFMDLLASERMDLVVAGVHLTCGLTDGSVAAKHNQLKRLTGYLAENHASSPWIVAGDFDIATSAYTIDPAPKAKSITEQTAVLLSSLESGLNQAGLADAWSIARLEGKLDITMGDSEESYDGEAGATFDPRNNALAADSTNTFENRPQRYDRIFVRSHEALRVGHFNLFGVQSIASDHYGVRATLHITSPSTALTEPFAETARKMKVEHKEAATALSDPISLQSMLYRQDMIPTEKQMEVRQQAFELLKNVVLGTIDKQDHASSGVSLNMVAVGSYALGVWTADSDLDCLCVGSVSSKTFFKLVRQRLARARNRGIKILRKVEAKTGTMLELSVDGISADLHYCPAARIAERWSEFHGLSASDPIFNLPALSLRKLKSYRDFLYIQRTLPSLSAFRTAFRCIKLWAVQRGIYSSKFGYLSGTHITLMLTWICKKLRYQSGSVGPPDMVVSFFSYYANFDWTNELLFDAFFHESRPRYHRSAREPMVILGYHAPHSNIAHTSTTPGLQILMNEFRAAADVLSSPGITWAKFFGDPSSLKDSVQLHLSQMTEHFLATQHSFVTVEMQYWGRTLAKGKGLVGWIESRCLSLVVDIHKMLPELEVRIWPTRFTNDKADLKELKEYHGCYLIGLTRSETSRSSNKKESQLARQSLEKVLDRFLTQLRTDDKNYDSSTSWVDVSLAKPFEVRTLRLDNREWGDHAADIDPDSDDDDDFDDEGAEEDEKPLERTLPQRPKPTAIPVSTSKLRPASDVLNRLRWDPGLDPSDYIIGYEDRFLGAKEANLDKWKTEQTDEEFIPQHRILYFKKKGGDDGKGELVWERATRLDKVFGSGAGPMDRRYNL
ncbi:hypothetical protein IAQ61_010378, partial [Plenodomus lingam]|uniref:uncharacterized protein n=1 Tax=Leptosphaeria maculans TaxID=5022 RepID=UPI00332E9EFC